MLREPFSVPSETLLTTWVIQVLLTSSSTPHGWQQYSHLFWLQTARSNTVTKSYLDNYDNHVQSHCCAHHHSGVKHHHTSHQLQNSVWTEHKSCSLRQDTKTFRRLQGLITANSRDHHKDTDKHEFSLRARFLFVCVIACLFCKCEPSSGF